MKQLTELENFMTAYAPQSGKCKGIAQGDAVNACKLGAVMLDIREDDFTLYKQFQVPQVLYLPLSKADDLIENLPDDCWLIVADAAGNFSRYFAQRLIESGLSTICILSGGIVDWERAVMPVSTDVSKELSGSCVCQLKKRNLNN